jgi:hypothetical protein
MCCLFIERSFAGTPCGVGGITIPGANNIVHDFDHTQDIMIDLSDAETVDAYTWDTYATDPITGTIGIYDPGVWAVFFKYASVNIGPNATVTFTNHPSGAPVVWLVSGDVIIDGAVILDGAIGSGDNIYVPSEPGPGGFRGGQTGDDGTPAAGGHGPGGAGKNDVLNQRGGGGYTDNGAGTLAGIAYGSDTLMPLIGGSGGSAFSRGGGAGGGALLLAAAGTVCINGTITANGGSGGAAGAANAGGGSGGSIRLVADAVTGDGTLRALAGGSGNVAGSVGRIRIESNCREMTDSGNPMSTDVVVASPPDLFPEDATEGSAIPSLTPVRFELAGLPNVIIPSDPSAEFTFPHADVHLTGDHMMTLHIEARNVTTSWFVNVRVVPRSGSTQCIPATFIQGNDIFSEWAAEIDATAGFSALQVRADPIADQCPEMP